MTYTLHKHFIIVFLTTTFFLIFNQHLWMLPFVFVFTKEIAKALRGWEFEIFNLIYSGAATIVSGLIFLIIKFIFT